MDESLAEGLRESMGTGGAAYIRNLAAAEAAIQRGQFNLAKVLRAVAHSQRTVALNAARLLADDWDPAQVLAAALEETTAKAAAAQASPVLAVQRSDRVGKVTQSVLQRSIESLADDRDVLEGDVAQSIWGCYGCGLLIEGDRPDACPECGALSVEFEWFGPFYSATPEHLGQLQPEDIVATLATIPDEVEAAVLGLPDQALRQRPGPGEWCIAEIVGHMLETDLLFASRAHTVLGAAGFPEIPRPAPPWKLHEGKGYEEMPANELLKRLREARTASLALVNTFGAEGWTRRGLLAGSPVSLLDLGTWVANHDRGHLAQIVALAEKQQHLDQAPDFTVDGSEREAGR